MREEMMDQGNGGGNEDAVLVFCGKQRAETDSEAFN